MKIVHLCLACFYIEGMEYQENVLPRKHRQLGHEVEVITSQFCFDSKGTVFDREVGEYVNQDDVKVRIIPYATRKYGKYAKNYRIFSGLYEILHEMQPEIIFCHGGQFNGVNQIVKYLKKNSHVKFFLDSHIDYGNAPVNTLKRKLLQRYYIGAKYRKLEPYCEKIWCTLPSRVQYVKEIYRVKSEKVQLLVMGGDVDDLNSQQRERIRNQIREKYEISGSAFLIVTGGKIDSRKNIHLLMEAVSKISHKEIKLLVFGEPNQEVRSLIKPFEKSDNIVMLGWLNPDDCYDLFFAADLAVFPGTHSVLWEQVCACGLPALFRGTDGQNHVDMGGNCQFLYNDSANEIYTKLLEIVDNSEFYESMRRVALEKGYRTFSYMEIAKKAIGI